MENNIEEAKLIQSIEANDKLEKIGKDTEASLLVQSEVRDAIDELKAPLDAIVHNTIKEEVQKVQILGAELLTIKGEKGDKGDKGDDGKTPEKGKDYFTDEDKLALIDGLKEQVTPIKGIDYFDGKDGEDGADGKDYILTNEDKKQIASQIEVPVVEKVIEKITIEKPIVKEKAKYETAEQIADKLNTLSKYLSWKILKDVPDIGKAFGSGYLRELSDVSLGNTNPNNGQVLTWSSALSRWIAQTPTTGSGTVTDVTASTPLASSGGTTPNISISQSGAGSDGYLSSGDWNTFNNKLTTVTTDATLTGAGTSSSPLGINLSNANTWTATQTFDATKMNTLQGVSVAGITLKNHLGSNVAIFGAGGSQGVTFYDGVNYDANTADTLAYFNGSKTLSSVTLGTGLSLSSGTLGVSTSVPTSIGAFGGSIANGLSISGNVLTLGAADSTNPGGVSTGTQTFAGIKTFTTTLTGSLGTSTALNILPTINQSGTAGYTGLLINVTETATGSGTKLPFAVQKGGVALLNLTSVGVLNFAGTTGTTTVQSNVNNPVIHNGTNIMTSGNGDLVLSGRQGYGVLLCGSSASGTQATPTVWVTNAGRVGIGIAAATTEAVEVTQAVGSNTLVRTTSQGGTTGFYSRHSRNSLGSPSASQADDQLGVFGAVGYGTAYATSLRGFFDVHASENWSASAQGTYLTWHTTLDTTTTTAEVMRLTNAGRLGIGVTSPTAMLHLKAGTSAASTAPLKFTSGTNNTTPEDGAVEYNGSNLSLSVSTTRYTLPKTLTGSATLDFPNTLAQTSSDLTITVTGASDGDKVVLGVPNVSVNANSSFTAWVSASNTVTVRFNNYSALPIDPASGTFKVSVIKD